jgi:serine/threonine protein phosphatase PrpC
MNVESIQLTDTGRKRSNNEDHAGAWEPDDAEERARAGCLYLVADGVGGAAAGEVASRYAVDKVLHDYFANPQGAGADAEPDPGERLAAAVQAANDEIYAYNQEHTERREMGTTLVGAVIRGSELHVANVGDSRAYLVRGGAAEQITQDHNVVAGMVRRAEITAEEAVDHPFRNRLTRCLGMDPEVSVDLFQHQLQPGDTVVLCSDGLTRHVGDADIAHLTVEETPQAAARALVDLANERGGEDNIAVTVIRLGATARKRFQIPRRRSLPEPELDTTYHRIAGKKRRRWPFSRD